MDRRPPRNWNTTTMTATTSNRWTKPPAEYELIMPSAHSTSRITAMVRSEEHTSELQSRLHLVCRLLLEKKEYGGVESVVGADDGSCLAAPGRAQRADRPGQGRVTVTRGRSDSASDVLIVFFFKHGAPHEVPLFPPARPSRA